jgi:hypothetical protein
VNIKIIDQGREVILPTKTADILEELSKYAGWAIGRDVRGRLSFEPWCGSPTGRAHDGHKSNYAHSLRKRGRKV